MFRAELISRLGCGAALLTGILWMAGCSAEHAPPPPAPDAQRHFQTAQEGVQALAAALNAEDAAALKEIFGAAGMHVIESGDAAREAALRSRFLKALAVGSVIVPVGEDRAVLFLGRQNWPFPVPLLKEAAGWRFDIEAGAREIAERRIGENELNAAAVLRAAARAQKEYARADRNRDGVPEYAQRLASSQAQRDGLYWDPALKQGRSPAGPLLAAAEARGQSGGARPFHGYYYRILTGQGPAAPGGALDYMVGGRLMLGFGMLAFPAEYGSSGIVTFIINQRGQVYERDLGPETAQLAAKLTAYDPGEGWRPVAE